MSEHALQGAVAAFLARALPAGCWHSSIDHAGTSARHGALLKARGVRRGLPDILIICNTLTIWIELKTLDGRVSIEQREFADAVKGAGHCWWVARSVQDVQDLLRGAGIVLRARLAA